MVQKEQRLHIHLMVKEEGRKTAYENSITCPDLSIEVFDETMLLLSNDVKEKYLKKMVKRGVKIKPISTFSFSRRFPFIKTYLFWEVKK